MKLQNQSTIIAQLLDWITLQWMMMTGKHIDIVQSDLVKHQWIKDALWSLAVRKDGRRSMAVDEWLKRHGLTTPENARTSTNNRSRKRAKPRIRRVR